ncbi:MAG: demethoxyubiquinone hydroxylase family protein [Gemmataceae bacterium]
MDATLTATPGAISGDGPDKLNSLLRGELSAIETYEQGIQKLEKYPAAAQELRRVRDEHREHARVLREHVSKHGGTPAESSGVWGSFTAAVTGAAAVLGPETTIAALKRGEEVGIADYERAIDQPTLPAECKELIAARLLPRSRDHLASLDSVLNFLK